LTWSTEGIPTPFAGHSYGAAIIFSPFDVSNRFVGIAGANDGYRAVGYGASIETMTWKQV